MVVHSNKSSKSSCQSGRWAGSGLSGLKESISGECAPGSWQAKICFIADLSWFCTLSGVGGAGESEFGYIERRYDGWYASTSRQDWPARYQWTCLDNLTNLV